MSTYTVSAGQQISDCVSNSTGDISNWSSFLTQNSFDNWTPILFASQILTIPSDANINAQNVADLAQYPANNTSIPDIYEQIAEIFAQMEGGMSAFVPSFHPIVLDTNTYYEILQGQSISDVIVNSTGDITNWNNILNNIGATSWTPDLIPGTKIAIPSDVIMNLNNFRALSTYPANNYSVPDIDEQILIIFETMNNPIIPVWILQSNFWNDVGTWIDTSEWQD